VQVHIFFEFIFFVYLGAEDAIHIEYI